MSSENSGAETAIQYETVRPRRAETLQTHETALLEKQPVELGVL